MSKFYANHLPLLLIVLFVKHGGLVVQCVTQITKVLVLNANVMCP